MSEVSSVTASMVRGSGADTQIIDDKLESGQGSSKLSTRIGGRSSVSDFSSDPSQMTEFALLFKVLRGTRESPISLQEFQEYLDKERSGELSRFFVEAEKHEINAKEGVPQAIVMAHEITEHYIRMDAEEEINLSEQDRRNIIQKLEENDQVAGIDPALFKDAKGEVIKMLSGDKFQRFLKRQTETNISQREANRRWTAGVLMVGLSLTIVGVLMWVQTFAQPPFNTRWWRLVISPILLFAVALILSSRARVCAGLVGDKCVRMRENESWFSVYKQQQGTQVVRDEMAVSRIIQKARQLNRESICYSLAVMTLLIVLPPGYGVLVEG